MKKSIFKVLNRINSKVLSSYLDKDPAELNNFQKAIVAYRYFVLIDSK